MTDRVSALTVVLETDFREDDVRTLIKAIMQFRGVLRVNKHVSDTSLFVAESRVRNEFRVKLFELIK